jgi:hypothetical protein
MFNLYAHNRSENRSGYLLSFVQLRLSTKLTQRLPFSLSDFQRRSDMNLGAHSQLLATKPLRASPPSVPALASTAQMTRLQHPRRDASEILLGTPSLGHPQRATLAAMLEKPGMRDHFSRTKIRSSTILPPSHPLLFYG